MLISKKVLTLKTITLTVGLFVLAAGLTSCETSEDRQLAAGQACLDSATNATTANSCITIVQGLTSSESYLIRCSANFVAQGFTASRLASSVDKIKNNGGQDQMTGIMAFLVFTNQGTAHTADQAVLNCQNSGVKSMLRLATAAQLATTIAGVGGVNPNGTNPGLAMDALIAGYNTGNVATTTSIGNTAVTANQAYCATGSSYETTDICKFLKTAVASSTDPYQIGVSLMNQLKLP